MPAYSFQGQFVPNIEDESKDHTVRAERAGRSRHARPGETVYLYFGMRTKWCRKIGEATCSAVHAIRITETEILVPLGTEEITSTFVPLPSEYCDMFAWKDGFRPEGSTADNSAGAFELMIRFWRQTHELPFQGVVIFWTDFKPAIK